MPPQMMRMSEEVPDYETTLTKKDFFPKIFLIPSEVRLDKCTKTVLCREGTGGH